MLHSCCHGCFCPVGTTFAIKKTFDWASCQNIAALSSVSSRDALLRSGGNSYWVDGNNCLHLKMTDPGHPWQYTDGFTRDGLYVEEEVSCSRQKCRQAGRQAWVTSGSHQLASEQAVC